MSEKFEEEINKFYQNERIANSVLINTEGSSVSKKDLANNLEVCLKYEVLLSRVCLKHFKLIEDKLGNLENRISNCEDQIRKASREEKKTLTLIANEITQNKPLTKKEVQTLVKEIAQQPKLVEEKALELTSKLDEKLERVEKLVQHLVNWNS